MKTFEGTMHPSLARAYDILEPMFERYIVPESGQGLLGTKKAYMPVLNSLPDDGIRKKLYDAWEKSPRMKGAERWQMMKDETGDGGDEGGGGKRAKLEKRTGERLLAWRRELVLRHTYPRLDVNVSKQQNHLLKSPFCVHPKTGRVCIPIDPKKVETFDPFNCPTVRVLEEEINDFDMDPENANNTIMSDTEKTSLQASVEFFERDFLEGLRVTARKEARDRADRKGAMHIDF